MGSNNMVLYLYDSEAKYERNKDKLNNGQQNNLPPKETNNINDDKNINNQQNVNLQNDTKIDTKIDMKTNMNTNIKTANVNDNFSQQHNDPNINQNIDQLSPLNRPDNYIQGFDYNGMSQSGNYNLLNDNKTDDKMDNKKNVYKKRPTRFCSQSLSQYYNRQQKNERNETERKYSSK